MIVTIDGPDATVLKAKVSPDSLAQWMSDHDVTNGDVGVFGMGGDTN